MNNQGLLGDLIQTTSPTYVDGKFGKSMSTGGYKISASQTAQVLNNEAISICFWVYIGVDEGTTSNLATFFGTIDMGSNNNRKYSIFNYPSVNDLHWSWMNDNAIFTTGTLSGVLPSYQWTHVAVTYQNPNGAIYINGEKVRSFTGVSNSSTFAYDTQVIHNSTYLKWNDYRIFDSCLSQKEITEIYNSPVCHFKLSGVGKENLLINSGNYTINSPLTVSSSAKDGWNVSINLYASLEANVTYTLSARQDGTWITGHNMGGVDSSKRYNSLWLYLKDGSSYNFFNMSNGYANFTPKKSGTYYVRTNTYSDGTNTVTVNYWDIKLEEGSKPTAWIPNKSDSLYSVLGFDDNTVSDTSGYSYNGLVSSTSPPRKFLTIRQDIILAINFLTKRILSLRTHFTDNSYHNLQLMYG